MGKNKKRLRPRHRPPNTKKHKFSSSSTISNPIMPSNPPSQSQISHNPSLQQTGKRPSFPSYHETPNLPPKVKLLCEIIENTPSATIEKILEEMAIQVNQEDVEEVLKLSYGFPGQAAKFFRWSGHQLNDLHSPYAWNLIVDLLGKNFLFEPMWDAIKSMKKEELLSLATFASVFSSYVVASRIKKAIMAFEVMDQYGIPHDTVALNSFLSAICRDGKTNDAFDFLSIAKRRIRPDSDTYAILLEGWESEGNVAFARSTFSEMVMEVGWDPHNVPAYDSFLGTLLKGPDGIREAMKYFETMREKRCYPGLKFFKVALDVCVKKGDAREASSLWKEMIENLGFRPDTQMYNTMIAWYCYKKFIDMAKNLLDEMVCYGVFPDEETYNLLFQFLLKSRKLREGSVVFSEMIKNECVPNHANCNMAVRIYIDNGDPYTAIKVWKCMIENYKSDLEAAGNLLVVGLQDQNRVPEAVKYAEDMIDRGIQLNSSTMSKLEQSLVEVRKVYKYEELLRKWKTRKGG